MFKWSLEKISLPLSLNWKTARSSCDHKDNYIVTITSDDIEACGEVAVCERFGETHQKIEEGFAKFMETNPSDVANLEVLIKLVAELELPNSLKSGLEQAFVHYLAILSDKDVNDILGVQSINSVLTSFSIPIMPVGQIQDFIKRNDLNRFKFLKLKIDEESARDIVKEVRSVYRGNLRLDGNEGWNDPDKVMKLIEDLGADCPIEFLEQPLPAKMHDEYLYLKDRIDVDLFADESLTSEEVTPYFEERFHGVNIKLMKAGGYMKALAQIRDAKELGLKTMLGCMVETSIGISAALNIAKSVDYWDLDGSLLLKKDPFGLVTEEKGRLFFSHLQ